MYIYPIESDTVYRVALDSGVNWISRQPDKSYEKQALTTAINGFIVRIMLRSSVAPKGALTTNPRYMTIISVPDVITGVLRQTILPRREQLAPLNRGNKARSVSRKEHIT